MADIFKTNNKKILVNNNVVSFLPVNFVSKYLPSFYPPVTFSGVTLFCHFIFEKNCRLTLVILDRDETDDILVNDQILVFVFFYRGGSRK